MPSQGSQQDYISNARKEAKALLAAINNLYSMQEQWNALNYGQTLANGQGENSGVTAAMVGSAVFDTTNAMIVLLSQGHGTNLANLI